MPNYLDLQNHVSLEIRGYGLATDTGVIDLIKASILWAIRSNEHKLLWFNNEVKFATVVAGEDKYLLPEDYASGISVSMSDVGNTQRWELERGSDVKLDKYNAVGQTRKPKWFSIFDNQIKLYPVPDAEYRLYTTYVKKFPTLSTDTDTNPWVNEAFDFLAFSAEARLALVPFRDNELALGLAKLASEQFKILEERTSEMMMSGVIHPTEF